MEHSKIAIKTSRGWEFLRIADIICCIAHGRYTRIVTLYGKEYMVTRVLKEIQEILPEDDFFRSHKSYLINLNHIIHYHNSNEKPITLMNDVKIELAKRRRQEFHKRIREVAMTI